MQKIVYSLRKRTLKKVLRSSTSNSRYDMFPRGMRYAKKENRKAFLSLAAQAVEQNKLPVRNPVNFIRSPNP